MSLSEHTETRTDEWATSQVQSGMAILLAEQAAEEHRDAYRGWLVEAARKRLADAQSHERFADFLRRNGSPGAAGEWSREARRALAMSEHYARKAETI
jgi:hypothetical protein